MLVVANARSILALEYKSNLQYNKYVLMKRAFGDDTIVILNTMFIVYWNNIFLIQSVYGYNNEIIIESCTVGAPRIKFKCNESWQLDRVLYFVIDNKLMSVNSTPYIRYQI